MVEGREVGAEVLVLRSIGPSCSSFFTLWRRGGGGGGFGGGWRRRVFLHENLMSHSRIEARERERERSEGNQELVFIGSA